MLKKNKIKYYFSLVLTIIVFSGVLTGAYLMQKPKNTGVIRGILSGDCNTDGKVDIIDFQLLSNSFGKTVGQTGYDGRCDFNSSSSVDILDFQILSNNLGKVEATLTPTQIPTITPTENLTPTAILTPTPKPDHTLVGVRWFHAFTSHGSNGHDRRNVFEQWLSKQKWSYMWPYYTIIRSNTSTNTTVDIHQDNQQIINQEIQLAASAGLDYFAFESGPIDPQFALDLYLTSPWKSYMKFALVTPMGSLDDATKWDRYLTTLINLMKDPQYVRIKNIRPLLFLEQTDPLLAKLGAVEFKNRISELSNSVLAAVGHRPYLVLYNWQSTDIYNNHPEEFGIQARAMYNCLRNTDILGAPYSALAASCVDRWDDWLGSPMDYVPTAQVALDTRSRVEGLTGLPANNTPYYEPGTPTEIASHVKQAIDWVKAHPTKSPANAVVIAAWSDYSEGGWLEPTINEGNARLNALSKVLGGTIRAVPKSPYADNPPPAHAIGTITNLSVNDGATFPANVPIHITGSAPAAVRINFKLYTSSLKFINGDSYNFYSPDIINFAIDLPALAAGGPYTLTLSSPDINTVTVRNITIK